jgi:thymidine kinase
MSFRVRFAANQRLSLSENRWKILGGICSAIGKDITEIVIEHQTESLLIWKKLKMSSKQNIFIIDESQISLSRKNFKDFFIQKLSPS